MKSIMWQILCGLSYIHSRNVIHRDIKLNNIYIKNEDVHHPEIEIADFGCAAAYDSSFDNAFVGTPVFVAPEVYQGVPYDFKADVWSFGVTIFELITGKVPFKAFSEKDMMTLIGLGYDSEDPNIPADINKILEKCLHANPRKRASFAEIKEMISKMPEFSNLSASRDTGSSFSNLRSSSSITRIASSFRFSTTNMINGTQQRNVIVKPVVPKKIITRIPLD